MDARAMIEMLQNVSKPHLEGIHPLVQERALNIISVGVYSGLNFGVFRGGRSWEVQSAYYAQGRLDLETVNERREVAGMSPIPESENYVVTNARPGDSWHNYFLAVDLVEDGNPDKAGIQWSWRKRGDYVLLGKIIRSHGLEWGGLWKSMKDYPHAQLTVGMSISQARLFYQRGGKEEVWKQVEFRLGKVVV